MQEFNPKKNHAFLREKEIDKQTVFRELIRRRNVFVKALEKFPVEFEFREIRRFEWLAFGFSVQTRSAWHFVLLMS